MSQHRELNDLIRAKFEEILEENRDHLKELAVKSMNEVLMKPSGSNDIAGGLSDLVKDCK